jgi:hypothetical protein
MWRRVAEHIRSAGSDDVHYLRELSAIRKLGDRHALMNTRCLKTKQFFDVDAGSNLNDTEVVSTESLSMTSERPECDISHVTPPCLPPTLFRESYVSPALRQYL